MTVETGNALLPPPRATGNAEVDLRAALRYITTLYDQLIVGGNVLGTLTDHEARLLALESRVTDLENP